MQVLKGMGPQDPSYPYDHPYFGQLFLATILKLIGYPAVVLDQPSSSPSSSHSLSSTTNISSNDFTSTTNVSNGSGNNNIQHSIEMLYLVPRVLMGILAVIDTFLVYRISERRYNRNVAVIASVLFAVMPMTWLLRRILLDSILLPLLLSSILFALYAKDSRNNNSSHNNVMVLLSGVFLGIAIFTKIPGFTMIPLVAFFLVYNGNNNRNNDNIKNVNNKNNKTEKKKLTALGLWLIPVILIPLIWPIYSLAVGQFNLWIEGVILQAQRQNEETMLESIDIIFGIDPILLIIGIAGIGFSVAIKRDFIFVLWVVPFVVFFISIALVQYFYWILVLPAFCIAAARLIEYVSDKITRAATTTVIVNSRLKGRKGSGGNRDNSSSIIRNDNNNDVVVNNNNNRKKNNSSQRLLLTVLPFTMVSGIGIFGLVSTALLVTTNVNISYFNIYSFIVQHLPDDRNNISTTTSVAAKPAIDDASNDNKVTVLSSHWWIWNAFWTSKYVFHKDFDFIDPHFDPHYRSPIKTEKILFVADGPLTRNLGLRVSLGNNSSNTDYSAPMQLLYDESDKIAKFTDNVTSVYNNTRYPFSSIPNMILGEDRGVGKIEIRANY
jgi:hypothetical protein